MRNVVGRLLGIAMLLLLPCAAMAQKTETPSYEVFGGYSYMNADYKLERANLHGWAMSVTANANKWLGIEGQVSGHYGKSIGQNTSVHTFMVGPKFTSRSFGRVTPFAHILLGGARFAQPQLVYIGDTSYVDGYYHERSGGMAVAAGFGVDVKVSKKMDVRLFQVDYILAHVFQKYRDNIRVSSGVVFKFGNK